MSQTINVIKSDGTYEPLDINKIIRWASWATIGCPDVSLESLITSVNASFYDGMSTNDITIALCKSCEDASVIAAEQKQYNLVRQYFDIARNLYIPSLLKKVNNLQQRYLSQDDIYSNSFVIGEDNQVPLNRYKLKSVLKMGIDLGMYDSDLLDGSLPDELFEYADSILDYSKMNLLYFNGLRQMEAKYLTSYGKEPIEDPQQHFMLIALSLAHSDSKVYSKGKELEFLKESVFNYYIQRCESRENTPTPFSVGIRTPHKQYDSCFLKGSPVNTLTGLVNIEDITNQHEIILDDGNTAKVVKGTNRPYKGLVYNFKTQLNPEDSWYATEDHQFRVKAHPDIDVLIWKQAKDIVVGDQLFIPLRKELDNDLAYKQARLSNNTLVSTDWNKLEILKQYFLSSGTKFKVELTDEPETDVDTPTDNKNKYKLSLITQDKLSESKLLFSSNGVYVPVNSINTKEIEDTVYDLTVDGNNPSFTINSLAVHNCLLFEIDDDNNSIDVGMMVAHKATVAGAGVGVSVGAIRAKGKLFRKTHIHNGVLGYLGQLTKTIKGSSQQTRGGSATVNMSVWHRDFYELVMLKDVTSGIEGENRFRDLDYSFHFSQYILSKLSTNGKILLASPNELTDSGKTLYEAFYNVNENGQYDDSEFIEYCESKLADPDLPYINANNTQTVKAGELCYTTAYDMFSTLASQMMSVGRIYTLNVTHINNHSSYLDAIKMSNLCMEITQPTTAVYVTYDSKQHQFNPSFESEASFCQLGGYVFGHSKADIEKTCYWIIRTQESVFNISEYSKIPFSHKQKARRNIGIGLVNTQRMLVEEVYSKFPKHKWIKETARVTHEYMEAIQYYLLKASCDLAKELGPCEFFNKTKYSKGILPIDTYTKTELNDFPLLLDWEELRANILKYGLRFSSHTAFMPVESSSVIFSKISGSEFPRAPVTFKGNKKLSVAVCVPDIELYGDAYVYAWDKMRVDQNDLYLAMCSNINKFGDQSISYNFYFNLANGVKIDELKVFNTLFIKPAKEGIKTTYYLNFNTDSDEESDDMTQEEKEFQALLKAAQGDSESGCAGGGCSL